MDDFVELKNKLYKLTEFTTFSRLLKSNPTLCSAYLSKVAYFSEDSIRAEMAEFGSKKTIVRSSNGILYYIVEFGSIVCVCFRGTVYDGSWKNIMVNFGIWKSNYYGSRVHWGYKKRIEGIDKQLKSDILNKFNVINKELLYTGHSKGGSLASIFSFNTTPDYLITFGSARVSSDKAFKKQFEGYDHYVEQVLTSFDLIPRLPPKFIPIPYFGRYGFYGKISKKRLITNPINSHRIDTYIKVLLDNYE